MATFFDMMNQAGGGLNAAFQNPWTQLGMQMLAAGGYQQGDPGFGQRFAQAGLGFMQQREKAEERETEKMLRQMQMSKYQADFEQVKREQQVRQRLMEEAQRNPNLIPGSPLANAVLAQTGDISQIGDIAKIGQPDPMAAYRQQQLEMQQQRMQSTDAYRQQQLELQRQQLEQGAQTRQQQMQATEAYRQQQLELERQRTEAATTRAQTAAGQQWTVKDKAKWNQDKRAATGGLANAEKMLNRMESSIIKLIGAPGQGEAPGTPEHPGFNYAFGIGGAATKPLGPLVPSAADARAVLDTLKAQTGLAELSQLKAAGASLGQVSNYENQMLQNALVALQESQSPDQARQHLGEALQIVRSARENLRGAYQTDYGIEPWKAPGEQGQPQQGQQMAPPTADDVMTPADIEATMQDTGWSREEVIRRARARGIKIGG